MERLNISHVHTHEPGTVENGGRGPELPKNRTFCVSVLSVTLGVNGSDFHKGKSPLILGKREHKVISFQRKAPSISSIPWNLRMKAEGGEIHHLGSPQLKSKAESQSELNAQTGNLSWLVPANQQSVFTDQVLYTGD